MHNTNSQAGATILAERIKQFWIAKGFNGIETHTEQSRVRDKWGRDLVDRSDFWVVRSNIGPLGYPPSRAEGSLPRFTDSMLSLDQLVKELND